MKIKSFKVKFEEIPAIGEFIEASFLNDKEEFAAFSPMYANGYAENYHSKLLAVKEAASPHLLTARMKQATENQYAAQAAMLKLLSLIERYCQLAQGSLPLDIKNLKFSDFRRNIRKHDAEAIVAAAKYFIQSIQPCLPALVERGLTAEKVAEMNTFITAIETNNLEQNVLMNERGRKIEDNYLFYDFWNMVEDIMKTGKLIHQDNALRQKEYAKKTLVSRVRVVSIAKPVQEIKEAKPEAQASEAA
jgi:hypothetical protein